MSINKALLKYGYAVFQLEILEYCDPMDTIKREQYYIDILNPKYNILQTAGSSIGHKHTEETRKKISAARLGQPRPEGSGRPCQAIEVVDIHKNETTVYESMGKAALALGVHIQAIRKYIKGTRKNPFKNRYIITKT